MAAGQLEPGWGRVKWEGVGGGGWALVIWKQAGDG